MTKETIKKIKIIQIRSVINRPEKQKRTIQALGLHRIRHSVIQNATPQILGMVKKVKHLVQIEEMK
jgi:large subunit ribosomal protein L30